VRGSVKVKAKARKARWRGLKQEFDAAHQQGIAALDEANFAKLAEAIRIERVVINEQAALE
jgi:hypothetical protein